MRSGYVSIRPWSFPELCVEATEQAEPAAGTSAAAGATLTGPLPALAVRRTPDEIVKVLDEAARRGRVAGFHPGQEGVLFTTAAFSHPFEGILEARATPSGAGTTLTFTNRLKPTVPLVYVVVLLVTIWPGVIITKQLLASMFPNTGWLWAGEGYWWVYMGLTVGSAPLALWSAWKRSNREMRASSHEMVQKLALELGV